MSSETRLHLYNRMMSTRDELRPEDAERMSEEIERRVTGMEEFRTALRLGLYAAFGNEVRTDRIFVEGDRRRKEIYFPAVDVEGGGLDYFRVLRMDDLLHTTEGFREPGARQSRLRDINTLDALIVPGVAFDLEGGRIGFGKGFYDKCLQGYRGKRIALAYDFQVVTRLPSGATRHVLEWIVTEARIIRCGR
jgi:5-formyltetrahydrofolate cyclo-ligase